MPPGIDPQTAKTVIEYLKQNPEAAQQSYIEAQKILHTPGMAQSVLNSRTQNAADPAYQAKLEAMQSDPDLKHVFDDIKANGAGAMEKYWNDSELMSKISEKMGGINLNTNKDPKKAAPSSQVSLWCLTASVHATNLMQVFFEGNDALSARLVTTCSLGTASIK